MTTYNSLTISLNNLSLLYTLHQYMFCTCDYSAILPHYYFIISVLHWGRLTLTNISNLSGNESWYNRLLGLIEHRNERNRKRKSSESYSLPNLMRHRNTYLEAICKPLLSLLRQCIVVLIVITTRIKALLHCYYNNRILICQYKIQKAIQFDHHI